MHSSKILQEQFNTFEMCKKKLFYKLLEDTYLGENGSIKKELKFNISNPTFKIQNSKLLGNPDDKFETMLFLPEGEGRKGEGGLRTKGYFKFSYKKINDKWFTCDFYSNPIKEAPEDIQIKINQYLESIENKENITQLPLITVITVVYNGAKTIEQTIQSVINQTYPNVEYIIIDGGSTDGTLDIIKKYENYIDYWVSEPDDGLYYAMNKGIQVATGDYINLLNSDDFYYDTETVKKCMMYLLKENADALAGKWMVLTGGKSSYQFIVTPEISKKCIIHHQAFFYKRSIHKEIGLYDVNYKVMADRDFFYRIIKNSYAIVKINEIIVKARAGGFSDKYINQTVIEDFISRGYHFGASEKDVYNLIFGLFRKKILVFLGKYKMDWVIKLYRIFKFKIISE